MCSHENNAFQKGYKYIAGIDEAGRGPLAGPVVAAAVILPDNIFITNLKDSKKLSSKQRNILYEEIKSKALAFGIGMSDEKRIDKINILNATKNAMKQAINSLEIKPDIIFIDAVKLDHISIPQVSIIDGDNLSVSIAAASIIAKVIRPSSFSASASAIHNFLHVLNLMSGENNSSISLLAYLVAKGLSYVFFISK